MAQRTGVLGIHQSRTDQPQTFVKKTVAALLVRRLLAVEVTRNLIKLVESDGIRASCAAPKAFIPEKMPPREVPGVFFQPPAKKWDEALRFI
jgi:hypothetical protein